MLISKELESFIHEFKPHNHLILFYDTLKNKYEILYHFIANGLQHGKGTVYICSDEGPEEVSREMGSFGINVETKVKEGMLLIRNFNEWYIERGRVEPIKIITRWNKAFDQFSGRGLGMRVIGETSCFFRQGLVRELMRYEYALHKVLTIPMEAICAYNLKTIVDTGYTDVIMPLIRAHGKAIFTTEGGSMIFEPEKIEDTDIEKLLDIEI
ncbi:MAG: MEDS domain-containing protein [Candidatus Bathyarchaeota archaeon]|nr:MEDS domain-containing protein [Candidatus Bathyarchaeota archaeon]